MISAVMASQAHQEGEIALRQVDTVHEFPPMYFVENIAIRSSGEILVTVHNRSELIYINPNASQQKRIVVHTFPANASGIVEVNQDVFYVSVGDIGVKGSFAVYTVDMSKFQAGDDGEATTPAEINKFVDVPDALFLNGSAVLNREKGIILLADSIVGSIFSLDVKTSKVHVWLADKLLAKVTSNPLMPGVNGIQVYKKSLYLSNTDAKTFLRANISDNDAATGSVEILQEKLNVDDFSFDSEGSAYLTTHVFQSVVKLTQNGTWSRIAGGPDDRVCAGTTAAAFGRTEGDKSTLYVTTNGGMSFPVDGEIGGARLLRIDVGRSGS